MSESVLHILRNQGAPGHGRWKQCIGCGATTYGGMWYFGGYKSKTEPPCNKIMDLEWQKQAVPIDE